MSTVRVCITSLGRLKWAGSRVERRLDGFGERADLLATSADTDEGRSLSLVARSVVGNHALRVLPYRQLIARDETHG